MGDDTEPEPLGAAGLPVEVADWMGQHLQDGHDRDDFDPAADVYIAERVSV